VSRFFSSYIASIVGRDLQDVANVRNKENIERLLHVIAARSGGLASFHGMAADLGMDTNTARARSRVPSQVARNVVVTASIMP